MGSEPKDAERGADEAIIVRDAGARGAYVIVCEHASSVIPPEYEGLGLDAETALGHIGWDINAVDVASRVARALDAPLVTAPVSRLVIDLNRPEVCRECIPARSEDVPVPGNADLTAQAREDRLARWHRPFHDGLGALLDRRAALGLATFLVGIHSFTPVYAGVARPWGAGVLYRASRAQGERVARSMAEASGEKVGCNQPYDLWKHSNHTIPFHGDGRGLPAVIVEIRNDLLATKAGIARWADMTVQALRACSSEPFNPDDRDTLLHVRA